MLINYADFKEFMDWINLKGQLKFKPRANKSFPINYNCIYWAYLGNNIGSEEGKHRPVLVTRTYGRSTIVSIIPLTTKRLNDRYWYHVDLENENSTALVEQMKIIDIIRIDKPFRKGGKIASITEEDWKKINERIEGLYKLKPLSRDESAQE